MNDLKFACRQLAKHPAFTAVAVLTLALGIGANGVVFTWIRSVLVDTQPGTRDPGQLVVIAPVHRYHGDNETMSLPDLRSVEEQKTVFAGVTGSDMESFAVRISTANGTGTGTGTGAGTQWVWGQSTRANFFDVLGVVPQLGRGFLPEEDSPAATGGAIIVSHRFWQSRLGGRPDAVGQIIHVNERPVTVVGVTPPEFRGTMSAVALDVWVPLSVARSARDRAAMETSRGWRSLHTIARLADGVSRREAQTAVAAVAARLRTDHPDTNSEYGLAVLPMWRSPWGGQAFFRPALLALAAVGGLLLLLVIANLANLLLVRAQAREAEMAVRLAVGASRGRIVRQLLTESLVLALVGGGLGIFLGLQGAASLRTLMPPTYLPIALNLGADARVLLALALLSAAAGMAFGLAPALHASRSNLNEGLKAGGRGATRGGWPRLRNAFVVTEVALALVLLVGMGLCLRSLSQARQADLGLDPRGVWIVGLKIPEAAADAQGALRYYDRLRLEAEALPGVRSVTLSHWLPLGFEGGDSSWVNIDGLVASPSDRPSSNIIFGGPNFCATLGMRLVAGRDLALSDDATQEPVALVNEEFVRRYLGGRDPLNLHFGFWAGRVRIVGVVRNAPFRRLGEPVAPVAYLTYRQFPQHGLNLVVKSDNPPAFLRSEIDRIAARLEPATSPVASMQLEDYIGPAFAIPRVSAAMMSALGVVALILATLGTYAVLAQCAAQREREFGVRLALGAAPHAVARLILGQGFRLLAAGLLLGALGAAVVGRVLGSILVGVRPWDLASWLTVATVLSAAVLLACWLPARRAARIDPVVALRCE